MPQIRLLALCNGVLTEKIQEPMHSKSYVCILGLALQRGQKTIRKISHLPEKKPNLTCLFKQLLETNQVEDFTKFKISLDSKGYYYSTMFFEHFTVLEGREKPI